MNKKSAVGVAREKTTKHHAIIQDLPEQSQCALASCRPWTNVHVSEVLNPLSQDLALKHNQDHQADLQAFIATYYEGGHGLKDEQSDEPSGPVLNGRPEGRFFAVVGMRPRHFADNSCSGGRGRFAIPLLRLSVSLARYNDGVLRNQRRVYGR